MITNILLFLTVINLVVNDCAFTINDTLYPNDPSPQQIHGFQVLQANCADYIGNIGCCNHNAFIQTSNSFRQIDTVFGTFGGGCDVCAVNLKRFWCQYSCSPNQSNFAKTFGYVQVPSFSKPGELLWVQKVQLTIQSNTACQLFQSCKRTPYAAQLSATQTPAGFLNFQGANAIQDGAQTISIKFTDNQSEGLYIPHFDNCNYKLPTPPETYYGYEVTGNCTCNSCQSQCSGTNYYKQTPVLEGFNYVLVGGVWGVVLALVGAISVYRYIKLKKQ